MYIHPAWSIVLIVGVIAVWFFVIRPRLKVPLTDTYTYIDGFWARVWARIVAFRSYFAALFTAVMIGLPDIAVALTPIDLSDFVGHWWAQAWTTALAIYLAINRALATKPRNEQV